MIIDKSSYKCRAPLAKLQMGNYIYFLILEATNVKGFLSLAEYYVMMSQKFKFHKTQSKKLIYELREQGLLNISKGKIYVKWGLFGR